MWRWGYAPGKAYTFASEIAAAPSVADLDGNGTLEIVTTSIDHGLDVYTVPGSKAGLTPWPTGRGNLLRSGTATR